MIVEKEKIDMLNMLCNSPNLLAHVTDVVGSEEEVLKSLVAHFEHALESEGGGTDME